MIEGQDLPETLWRVDDDLVTVHQVYTKDMHGTVVIEQWLPVRISSASYCFFKTKGEAVEALASVLSERNKKFKSICEDLEIEGVSIEAFGTNNLEG